MQAHIDRANEAVVEEQITPIGKGFFGNIYNQFKDKFYETFDFLVRKKNGDALAVLNRKDIGDIDIVWGNTNAGLQHIIVKHTGEGKSFETIDVARNSIADILENGEIAFQNGDKVVIKKGNQLVTLRRNR